MALVTKEEVEDRANRTFEGAAITQVEALIVDVSAEINEVADKTWTTSDVPATVVPIAVRAVMRGVDNPHGLESETIGAYTWRDSGDSQTGIYLTRLERKKVRRAAGKLGVSDADLESWLPAPDDPNVSTTESLTL